MVHQFAIGFVNLAAFRFFDAECLNGGDNHHRTTIIVGAFGVQGMRFGRQGARRRKWPASCRHPARSRRRRQSTACRDCNARTGVVVPEPQCTEAFIRSTPI